jgi:hypothetical protein
MKKEDILFILKLLEQIQIKTRLTSVHDWAQKLKEELYDKLSRI